MVELEARKLKYPTTGSELLLMGILTEGTSAVTKWLWKHGITLFAVRDETVELLGKVDMYFFTPEHPSLTQPAQNAIDWAMDEAIRLGEISTTMLLLGIWEQKGSAGQLVLGKFDFDKKKAAEVISTWEGTRHYKPGMLSTDRAKYKQLEFLHRQDCSSTKMVTKDL